MTWCPLVSTGARSSNEWGESAMPWISTRPSPVPPRSSTLSETPLTRTNRDSCGDGSVQVSVVARDFVARGGVLSLQAATTRGIIDYYQSGGCGNSQRAHGSSETLRKSQRWLRKREDQR